MNAKTSVSVLILLGAVLGSGVGCYSPSILDGGLFCGPNASCPDNFSCVLQRCRRRGSDAGRADAIADGGDGRASDGGALDGVDSGGGPAKTRLQGESCNAINAGTPNRTDTCVAGLVCVDGDIGSLCFKTCMVAADCAGTGCERRPVEVGGPLVSVCGLGPTDCSPIPPQSGCPPQRTCYLKGAGTICEISSGEGPPQAACSYPRECLPGLTCATGVGAGYCRRVCSDTVPCTGASACQKPTATALLGYCY